MIKSDDIDPKISLFLLSLSLFESINPPEYIKNHDNKQSIDRENHPFSRIQTG